MNDGTSPERPANRLIRAKSPYLLQHAHNPVDWFEWSDEAFEKARREDKPVFVSIGYSTCHWCHVMERESFEDEEVARAMNEAWVSVKVDREERPDLDTLYLSVCQAMTGAGGWPLHVIMTPDRRPFFAATYLPKRGQAGAAGMLEVAAAIRETWRTRREEAVRSAGSVVDFLRQAVRSTTGRPVETWVLERAFRQFEERFDRAHGGFGDAPKFPSAHTLMFLLRWWKRSGDKAALDMVERTLDALRAGGIYDHVGLGIHRYSVDERWLVPHFEKMLYDQAMLVLASAETFQATGKPAFERTARETIAYVLRDMASPEGAFYSGEDADSEGVEGKFYTWSERELRDVLGKEAGAAIETVGTEVLHFAAPVKEADRARFERVRERLLRAREKRVRPHRDDKILADWNGLTIAALAKCAQAFDAPEYAEAAAKAADFILSKMRAGGGRLLHRYRDGDAAIPAFSDDYAFFAWGLIELYEATFDAKWLEAALAMTDDLLAHFRDDKTGGFFLTADDAEKLLVRPKPGTDGALPSANSVAALDLLRLSRLTGREDLEREAKRTIESFSDQARNLPTAFAMMLAAADFALGPSSEVVVAGSPEARDTQAMIRALRRRFLPGTVVLLRPDDPDALIARLAPFTSSQVSTGGRAIACVCRGSMCRPPTTDAEEMLRLLDGQ